MHETVRDTTIVVPPDSAWLHALLECDSAGNVLMRELETYRGKNAGIEEVRLAPAADGKSFGLDVEFVADSLKLEIEMRDKIIENYRNTAVTEIREVPKPYPWWAKTLMAAGGAFALFVLAFAAARLIH